MTNSVLSSVHLNDGRSLIYDWFSSWVDEPPTRRFSPNHLHPLISEALISNSLSQYFARFLDSGKRLTQAEWAKAHLCFTDSLRPFEGFATTPLSKTLKTWTIANYDGHQSLQSPATLSQLLAAMSDFSQHRVLYEQHHVLHNYLLPLTQHTRAELPLCAGPYRELCELIHQWCAIEDQWLTQHAHR